MEIKGFFFDLDGTLIDSMEGHYSSWKKVLNSEYSYELNKEKFMHLEGTKLNVLIKNLLSEANIKISNQEMEKLIYEKDIDYQQRNKTIFYPNTIEVIKFLKIKKIKTSIVSAGSKKRIMSTLPNFFLKLFDHIISGDECKQGKPNPEPYLNALSKCKLLSKNCCVLENAPLGIESAIKANIFTIAITNTLKKNKLSKANKIISDIIELKEFFK